MVVKSLVDKGWDVKLTVAGDLSWDSSELEIRTLITKLGVRERIDLIGPYPNDEAQLILEKTDILLHLKYNDPCPNVVLEALALGIPVIGSDSGGMRELVGEHAGVLIPVQHSWSTMHYPKLQDVDNAVLLIMQSINTFRSESRKRAVELFDVSSWIRAHENIFSMLIKQR
jgi:glycosyltransferase involved in cell wall biosynthesis